MDWIRFHRYNSSGGDELLINDPKQNLLCDLSGINTSAEDPLSESIKAVHEIAKKYPRPYYLMASGGIDSQAMIYAWYKSGIPFTIIHFKYNDTFNEHDVDPLKILTENLNLSIEYKNIDHFAFLENDLKEYAKKYICGSPHITFYMKMADTITDGTVVFSGHPLIESGILHNFSQLGLYRYGKLSGRSIVPNFFLHTPSLGRAWFDHSVNINKTTEHILTRYAIRCYMYSTANFLIFPSKKLTGFENYKLLYDKNPKLVSLQQRLKYNKNKHVYDILFRHSLYEIHDINEVISYSPSLLSFKAFSV
jgi:hypothetical protein